VTQEEIRKLLGGYATNTLTEGERAALFEAALDDQDLFDALENEDALRELLADPVSREQIRQALEPVAAERRRTAWMLQPWLIGTAGVTVAAVIAIAVVTWHREPAATSVPRQLAQSQIESKPEAPQPTPAVPVPERKRAARLAAPSAELAAPPVAAIGGVVGGVVTSGPVPAAPKQALTDRIAGAPLYSGPLVRTSVLRSGPSGDMIRIEVVSQLAGELALYRVDAAGEWQRVFPANGPELAITANTAYQIPDDPIAVRGNQDKLRLVIEPAAGPGIRAQLATGALAAPRAQALDAKKAAPAPLVVEIPLGPN
jgi:hypothetical protein